MKLLVDSCLSRKTVDALRAVGYDVEWSGEADPGDPLILARAHAQQRVLITLDKDFGELAVLYGHPHSGIVRLVHIPARHHAEKCVQTLERYGGALEVGAIVTVEKDRTRVRVEHEDEGA